MAVSVKNYAFAMALLSTVHMIKPFYISSENSILMCAYSQNFIKKEKLYDFYI